MLCYPKIGEPILIFTNPEITLPIWMCRLGNQLGIVCISQTLLSSIAVTVGTGSGSAKTGIYMILIYADIFSSDINSLLNCYEEVKFDQCAKYTNVYHSMNWLLQLTLK